jgi:hypothetical protein
MAGPEAAVQGIVGNPYSWGSGLARKAVQNGRRAEQSLRRQSQLPPNALPWACAPAMGRRLWV